MRPGAFALVAAASLVVVPSPASGHRTAGAALRVASFAPVTIRGSGFRARESVRVDLAGVATARRKALANAAGTFTVRFDGVTATRCDLIRVIAVGSRGSRAGLKYLPSPACMPA